MFHFELKRIIEAQSLEEILETFYNSTGIRPKLVDVNGETQLVPTSFDYCSFCQLVRGWFQEEKSVSIRILRRGKWPQFLSSLIFSGVIPVLLGGLFPYMMQKTIFIP